MEVNLRAGMSREFALAGAVVCLNMRRNDCLDAHSISFGGFQILSDLELRIDDRCAALTASTEEIGGATCFGTQKLPKDHAAIPFSNRAGVCVSRMRIATTKPEKAVSAATTPIADARPNDCATSPAMRAPKAYPESRQRR